MLRYSRSGCAIIIIIEIEISYRACVDRDEVGCLVEVLLLFLSRRQQSRSINRRAILQTTLWGNFILGGGGDIVITVCMIKSSLGCYDLMLVYVHFLY